MSKTHRNFHGENTKTKKRSTKGKQSTSQVNLRIYQQAALELMTRSTSKHYMDSPI